jgi:DNA repair exonuclease SbcCD nuclease subunit
MLAKRLETKRIRILHTSDIHLGEEGFRISGIYDDRAERALKALVDLAIQVETSLLIVAGDLFDHNRVEDTVVELALQELLRLSAPVVILPGNHDCLSPDSVYWRPYFSDVPSRVHIFTALQGERFSFPELDLALWGKPIDGYGAGLRPMTGVPPRGRERWHIAVAHGHYVDMVLPQIHALQIGREEIVQSCQDYVALGHCGPFHCVCDCPVKDYYSGSASETGTVAIVDFSDEGVQVRPHPLPL